MIRQLLVLATVATAVSAMKTCVPGDNTSAVPTDQASIDKVCASFCSGECSFLNATADPEDPDRLHGDTGKPSTLNLYRVTPWNVTDIVNKDTGNPPGDMTFYFQNKGDGASSESFLNGQNIFAQFSVDVDGQWAPYKQCNPLDKNADPTKPHDNFVCEHDCIDPQTKDPSQPICSAHSYQNGRGVLAKIFCACGKTGRDNTTVGRSNMANLHFGRRRLQRLQHEQEERKRRRLQHGPPPPPLPAGYWACSAAISEAGCTGHSYPPSPPGVCEKCAAKSASVKAACPKQDMIAHTCSEDFDSCELAIATAGCSTQPNMGAQCIKCALSAKNTAALEAANCSAHYLSYACSGHHHHSWVSLGGFWYNTQAEGECQGSATPGDSSKCSWKAKPIKYCNESCVNVNVDGAVVAAGKKCFDGCAQPLVSNSTCYLNCYRTTLSGNTSATPPTHGMARKDILAPWLLSFTEDDPEKGGCPRYTPPDALLKSMPPAARADYERTAARDPCLAWAAHRESACRDSGDELFCDQAKAAEADACSSDL